MLKKLKACVLYVTYIASYSGTRGTLLVYASVNSHDNGMIFITNLLCIK